MKRTLPQESKAFNLPESKKSKKHAIAHETLPTLQSRMTSQQDAAIVSIKRIFDSKNMCCEEQMLKFSQTIRDEATKKIAQINEFQFRKEKTRDAFVQYLSDLNNDEKNERVTQFATEMVSCFRNRHNETKKKI